MAAKKTTKKTSPYAANRKSKKGPAKSRHTVFIETELTDPFDAIAGKNGFESRAESVRYLMRWVIKNKAFPA